MPLDTQWLKMQRWLAARTLRQNLPLQRDTGVVSFSFDDAPRTACHAGREVLERFDCHGTWYIAGGLTDQTEQGRPCHSVADLQALAAAGHHLGCHTYSHRPCDRLSSTEMAQEVARNAAFFAQHGLPNDKLHFSFPLGAFHLASKRLAAKNFLSSRITGGGLQVGHADLNALWSERLYARVMTPQRLDALAQETAQRRGWLIYYTHDVEAEPSQWGCTPQLMAHAVQSALHAGCKVLSVEQAVRYWSEPAMP